MVALRGHQVWLPSAVCSAEEGPLWSPGPSGLGAGFGVARRGSSPPPSPAGEGPAGRAGASCPEDRAGRAQPVDLASDHPPAPCGLPWRRLTPSALGISVCCFR